MGRTPSPAKPDLRRDLLMVAVAALLMRVLAWVLLSRTPFFDTPVVDASQFDIWARILADGREFQPGPFFKPPFYPYLLSGLYRIGLGIRGVYALQGMVGIASALLVTVIARRVLRPKPALAAGLVVALLPILPFFEFQLLAECWTTLFTLMAVAWLLTGLERGGVSLVRACAQAGAILGLAALGRPNLMLVVVAVAAWLVLVLRRDGKPWVRPLAALLVLAAVVMAPTASYNTRAAGRPVLVSTNLGANLITGNRDAADGISAIPVGVEWDDLQLRTRQAGAADAAAASSYLTTEALDWSRANPGRSATLLGRRLLALVSGWEPRNNIGVGWLARQHGVFVVSRWWPGTWMVLPFALAGLAAVAWNRRWALLAVVMGAQALSVLPFFVNARFRMPLLPLLAVFAVAGAVDLAAGLRRGQKPRRLVMGFFLGAIVLVNVDWLGLDHRSWGAEDAFNEAIIHLRTYADRHPDMAAAEKLLQRSTELDPQFIDAHERHGSLLLEQAQLRLGEAKRLMRQGDHAAVQQQAHLLLGGLDAAEIHHHKALRLFPRSYNSLSNLGAAFLMRGELYLAMSTAAGKVGDEAAVDRLLDTAASYFREALVWLERALAVNPDLTGVRENLAYAIDRIEAVEARNRTQ